MMLTCSLFGGGKEKASGILTIADNQQQRNDSKMAQRQFDNQFGFAIAKTNICKSQKFPDRQTLQTDQLNWKGCKKAYDSINPGGKE